jgi:glycosyltransferase involved in cell wall biosynthesis
MRIWIVNQYAVPPGQAGPTRHYSFARELIQRGHEVTVMASSFDHVCRREAHLQGHEWHRYEVVDGVPFLWFWTPSYRGNDLLRVLNMLAFASWIWPAFPARLLAAPDVIIGSVPTIFLALAASKLAGRLGVPFVLEVRDLWPEVLVEFLNVSSSHPAVRFLRGIEGYLYRRSERIITLLPGSLDYLADRAGCRDKVSWLPNGIDLNLVPLPTHPPANDAFTVMFIGNHGLAYGLDVLLDAAVLLMREHSGFPVRFRLIGDGPEKKRLQARVAREGIHSVRFEDPVPKRRIYEILQEADAFLMILRDLPVFRRGTSPNKVFDYLASVRPIIFCGNVTFDYVADARAGITVPPGDARSLAEAVMTLAKQSADSLMDMGWCGRRYVEDRFNVSRLTKGLEQVLVEVVCDHARKKSCPGSWGADRMARPVGKG